MKIKTVIISVVILMITVFSHNGKAQKLESEFLYKITLSLDKPLDSGKSPYGSRIAYPVKGGTFEGPKLKGKVKAVGEDWLLKVDDATNKLDVRLMLETEEGELIACTYQGVVHKKADGTTYWRITPTFQTNSKKYDWINYIVAVGKGDFKDGNVTYDVFAIN
ncbi:MAG: DUF3237 domain-containing protein [Leadbetterella sp.]